MVAAVRVAEWLANPRTQVRFNGACMVLWFVMVPVTLLTPELRTAILYVALMSVWANFATHLGGWISALVNVRTARVESRTDEMASLQHIEQVAEGLAAVVEQVQRMDSLQGDQLAKILDAIHSTPPVVKVEPTLINPAQP